MQVSKQTKNTLTLVLGIIIVLSMITLLYINIAIPDANSPSQIAVSGPAVDVVQPEPQQTILATTEAPPTEPAAQEPQAESEQTDVGDEAIPQKAKVNFIPVLIIVVILLALGVGGFFLVRFIIGRREDAEFADETDDELEDLDELGTESPPIVELDNVDGSITPKRSWKSLFKKKDKEHDKIVFTASEEDTEGGENETGYANNLIDKYDSFVYED